MITNGSYSRPAAIGATIQFLLRSKWIFSLAIAGLVTVAATSPPPVSDENTDGEYIRIMNLMDRADALRATGKPDAAKAKDQEAYRALMIFHKIHPRWNTKTVEYRLNQLTEEIEGRPKESESPTTSKGHTNLEAPAKHASTESMSFTPAAVKLLDAGAEPRKSLRYHLKAGDKQAVILTLKMSTTIDMAGMPGMSNASPAISLPADVAVQNVAANGDITFQMTFGEPIKGVAATGVITDRGACKKVEVNLPPEANPQTRLAVDQIRQNLLSMSSQLPEEAIGTGAKWEVKMPVKSSGLTLDQTTDFQLASVDGDHISTALTQTQSAENQKMQIPAMGQLNVTTLTNNATGNIASDLSKLMPLQATMNGHMEMNGEVTKGGNKQSIDQKTEMNATLEAQ